MAGSLVTFSPPCHPFNVTTTYERYERGSRGRDSGFSFAETRYHLPRRRITISYAPTGFPEAWAIARAFEEARGVLPMQFDHPDGSGTLDVVFERPEMRQSRANPALYAVTVSLLEDLP